MKTVNVVLRCTPEYREELKGIAKKKGMDTSSYLRHLIEKQKEEDKRNGR